jgi:uncharacterized protein (TIGR01777 family)
MRCVSIAGANGFIGYHLVQRLKAEGFKICSVSRADFRDGTVGRKIENSTIVINLVGESIIGLWSKRKRKRIYESRVLTTRKLVEAINRDGKEVELLIQVSGVAIYDNRHMHTEESMHYDEGFLSRVIHDWEGELDNLKNKNIRIVVLRLGIVLDKEGGMLKKLLIPLKLGFGFGVRSDDYFPFVQLEDLLNIFIFSINQPNLSGVVNVSAPVLTNINLFFREILKVSHGRFLIWVNKGLIRLLMGESGGLLTDGQQVIPAKLLKEGFIFRYDNIEDALKRACN